MKQNNIIKQSAILRFRQAETSDLDYIMEVEHAEENAKYVIPYDLEKHTEMLNGENTKHFIVESADGSEKETSGISGTGGDTSSCAGLFPFPSYRTENL
mgnify:CR=1 FL=1